MPPRTSTRLAVLMGGVSCAMLALAVPAFAQDTGATDDTVEVTVTATRRTEAARNVPIAVSAISGEKLGVLNSSGQDIRLLSGRVPSLIAESSFGRTYPRFYIRGLGNTDFDVNASQPVSVVYDDVALESPMLKSFPIFDVASVEVLRGPQGTLFGRNTPAGVVKINSAKPSDVFGGFGSLSLGTFGSTNVEAAVTGPIAEGLAFRVSGQIQKRDDWVENTATTGAAEDMLEGYYDQSARFQLSYKTGNFDALLNVHGRDLTGTPRLFRAGIFKKGTNDFVDGFDVEKVALDGPTSQSLSSSGVGVQLNYYFEGVGTLRSITGYEHLKVESSGDVDGGDTYDFNFGGATLGLNVAKFPVATGGITKPEELSQELRFETDQFGKWRGQVGLYYYEQNLYYQELDYINGSDVRHDNKATNFAVFGSAEYAASDALTLRGGLRYSSDDKEDLVYGTNFNFGPSIALPVTTKVDGNNLSGDFSATYVITPTLNWYGRVATGYLAPAIQDRVNFGGVPTTVDEQTTVSLETGLKGLAYDSQLRFDVSAYYFDTSDLQLTAVGGAVNTAKLINAETAIGYGLEADLTYRPLANLLMTAGASYNFTEIQDANLGVAPCGSGSCTVLDPIGVINGNTVAMIDGNPLPQAPKYVANFTARYAWPLANGGQVFAYTDWFYRSEANFFLYEAVEFESKPVAIGGLRVGYLAEDGTEFAAYVRNITDEIYAESAIDFNNLTGMVSDPRTFGVSIRKSF